MRLCDTCGEPTDRFTLTIPGRGGKRVPRCQPCRIATKACAALHRAPEPYDAADVERRLLEARWRKEETLAFRTLWNPKIQQLRVLNAEIRGRERDLDHHRAWVLTQMAETIADDPAFIKRLLEVIE